MTYCLALRLNDGIVFASDSRTHAGVDHVSSYSKMHAFEAGDDRYLILLSAGNLATTQAVVNRLRRDLGDEDAERSLASVDFLFEAAEYVGQVSCEVQAQRCSERHSFEASFILGGQIRDEGHDIFLIYPEGNYISASPAKPFLQIGEIKYGKPILDRVVVPETPLGDAARAALVSLDSTMRSNLSVGPPFELAVYRTGELRLSRRQSLEFESPFYTALQQSWNDGLREAFGKLPRFEWEG